MRYLERTGHRVLTAFSVQPGAVLLRRRNTHETGFIKRQTFEMSLDKVESVDVNQSILGRLMDYGDLTIQGVGEGTRTITTITSPLEFRNAVTTRPPS